MLRPCSTQVRSLCSQESVIAQGTVRLMQMQLQAQPKGKLHQVLDNAQHYRPGLVKEFVKTDPMLELMFLPPCSPDLKVIEQLWKLLRAKVTRVVPPRPT